MILQVRNILFVLLLIFLPHAAGAHGTKDIEQIISKGDSLLFNQQVADARELYQAASMAADELSNQYLKYYSKYREGYSYLHEEKINRARDIFTKIQSGFVSKTPIDSAFLFLVDREMDVIHHKFILPEYDMSQIERQYENFILKLRHHNQLRLTYLIGRIHQLRLEHIEATDYYEKLLGSDLKDKYLWEYLHYHLIDAVFDIGDFPKVLAISAKVEIRELVYISDPILYRYIALSNYALGRHKLTLNYYDRIIEEFSNVDTLSTILQNALTVSAMCNIRLGDTVKAVKLFEQSESQNNYKGEDVGSILYLYIQWADLYYDCGQFELALKLLNKGERILRNNASKPLESYFLYFNKANCIIGMGDTLQAIEYLDSIVAQIDSEEQATWFPRYWEEYNIILRWLYYMKRVYYFDRKSNTNGLQDLYEDFKNVLKVSQFVYGLSESTESKFRQQWRIRYDYENLFLTAKLLYEGSGDEVYLNDMLDYIERGKSIQFKSNLVHNEQVMKAAVPDDILALEKEYKLYLDRIRFLLARSEDKNLNNAGRIKLKDELPYAQYKYDSIHNILDLYMDQVKGQGNDFSIIEIQSKLKKDQIVLDYFITEERLFVFLIERNKTEFREVKLEHDLKSLSLNFHSTLKDYLISKDTKEKFEHFKGLSYVLYNYLIGPFETEIQEKRLIIIPDNSLGLIPFDALISDSNEYSYTDLNYLVKKNAITEIYSLDQLHKKAEKLNKSSKFIGFAPSYSGYSNDLYETLIASEKEISQIEKYFKGSSFHGNLATKETFINEAPKYKIVHLALHTKLDLEDPQHSQLLFAFEENPLTIYEIYGLKFKTKLLVLSGCNTGNGRVRSGEGVMNLARAFFFTGIKNIILTKWSISDKASADLMQVFYAKLYAGNSTDVALQHAKVEYLKNTDPLKAHPFYWAGYSSVGTPIYPSLSLLPLYLLISLVLGGLIIYFYKHR